MKLVFPNGEHEQVEIGPGTTVLGSGDDCDITLDVDGIAASHARLTIKDGSAQVSVDNAANITRVNGSLVVARTAVKGGDALLFGSVQCQVVGQTPVGSAAAPAMAPDDRIDDDNMTKVRQALPQYILRGVSGSTFGKHFPVYTSTLVGRHSECDICLPSDEISRKHAKIFITADGLFVEDLGSANGTFVNGKRIRREKIEPGDELKLDTVRFLVQAPGKDVPSKMDAPTVETRSPEPEPTGGSLKGIKIVAIVVVILIAAAGGLKVAGII